MFQNNKKMFYAWLFLVMFLVSPNVLYAQSKSKVVSTLESESIKIQQRLMREKTPIHLQLIDISQPAYKNFLASRVESAYRQDFGHVGLSAFYEPIGQYNGEKKPICFVLYNPNFEQELQQQFYAALPPRASPEQYAYISFFLISHELSHCLAHYTGAHSKNSQKEEFFADAFGVLLTTIEFQDPAIYHVIKSSRERHAFDPMQAHHTFKHLETIFSNPAFPKINKKASLLFIQKTLYRFGSPMFP